MQKDHVPLERIDAARPGPTPTPLEALVDNHRQFLAFLERRVEDRAVAEDLLQEAFARGLDRLETLRDGDSAIAWFYRALRNTVIDHYRRRGASQRALEAFAAEMRDAEAPGQELHREICRCVRRLGATLKPEYAQALEQIDVQEQPVKDFAQQHGITPGNAAVRVHRARQALRKQVAASCGTCAEHGCSDCTCQRGPAHPGHAGPG